MSAVVKRTPATGVLRGESPRGCNGGVLSICRGRSGDAFMRNHSEEVSELIAILDCVCSAIFPLSAATQLADAQSHCGKPTPAALSRICIRIDRCCRNS